MPQHLVKALVATEDERFYEHSGIDFKSTARAIVKLGKTGGGSTITQQLAKLLFTGEGSKNIVERILQKFKEYVIAVKLERQYTKEEILTMYLNKYDFLNLAVGIRSASRIYFGKEPIELTVPESAMLVGMLKNASYYNPLRREELVKNRRNVVLYQMYRNDFISDEVKDSLQLTDLNLNVATKLNEKWATALLLHDNFMNNALDMNMDGFKDMPTGNTFSLVNRYKYDNSNGVLAQFGVKVLNDQKVGGETSFNENSDKYTQNRYGLAI